MPDPNVRFWVYAHEHVVGPYDAQEISRLPVFGPELPLCAEALLGTVDELWRRAADTAELAAQFPPSLRTPEGQPLPKVGPWPPDPEKEALDALGTAQARMGIIDQSLAATQKRLELRREAYDKLKRELAARVAEAATLEEKIRGMGVRMGGFLGVKEEVDQARAALAMSNRRAADLEEHLGRVEAQMKEAVALAAEAAAEAKKRPKERPAPRPQAPAPEAKGSRKRPRRAPSGDAPDLGLPPATSVDVPDFS